MCIDTVDRAPQDRSLNDRARSKPRIKPGSRRRLEGPGVSACDDPCQAILPFSNGLAKGKG